MKTGMKTLNNAILHGWACIALLFILALVQFTDAFPNDQLYYLVFDIFIFGFFAIFANYQKIMIDNARFLRENTAKYEALCQTYNSNKDAETLKEMLFDFDLESSVENFEIEKQLQK